MIDATQAIIALSIFLLYLRYLRDLRTDTGPMFLGTTPEQRDEENRTWRSIPYVIRTWFRKSKDAGDLLGDVIDSGREVAEDLEWVLDQYRRWERHAIGFKDGKVDRWVTNAQLRDYREGDSTSFEARRYQKALRKNRRRVRPVPPVRGGRGTEPASDGRTPSGSIVSSQLVRGIVAGPISVGHRQTYFGNRDTYAGKTAAEWASEEGDGFQFMSRKIRGLGSGTTFRLEDTSTGVRRTIAEVKVSDQDLLEAKDPFERVREASRQIVKAFNAVGVTAKEASDAMVRTFQAINGKKNDL